MSLHRGVEQLVARRAHNPKAVGSSPAPATTKELSENLVPFFLLIYKAKLNKISNYQPKDKSPISLKFRILL